MPDQKFVDPVQPQDVKQQEIQPQEVSDALTDGRELLKKLTAKQELKFKKPIRCCGQLPCKGRTPNCYKCTQCVDCITGAGCGHSDSRHDPTAYIVQDED